MSFKSLIH